jgi:uncharacterized membrane protein
MRLARALLLGHATALVFGLAGMLIALPHPELWSASPLGQQAFAFGMQYAGPLHMVLGAAAMLAFGGAVLGWRRTLLFFGLACGLSLASELIGTGTGYPFGNYEYTTGLGYKILGRVPFSIPLSWFYMGLASYLLGGTLARWHPLWSVALGAYFLTVWDLVLDPAMAHPSLALNFWIWHQSGPYFGMPVQNFLGWTATGALFMGLSRWLWGAPVAAVPARFPLAVYALNMVFAMVLSAAGGVWPPIGLALACGLGGAAIWSLVARALDLHVVGLEHVPSAGPVILVARHYHHLYDAAAILASVPREVHVVIALDWLGRGRRLRLMRWLAAAARWPGVWRSGPGWRLNRTGHRLCLSLLREGRPLLVFPEGYPAVDPKGSHKTDPEGFLPFDAGFLVLAERAGLEIPILPVGLWYSPRQGGGWTVWLRFGRPLCLSAGNRGQRRVQVAAVEVEVRRLSAPPTG